MAKMKLLFTAPIVKSKAAAEALFWRALQQEFTC
jgi:hypothetical protein